MTADRAIEAALKRDRLIVIAALSTVIIASWSYILAGAGMGMTAFEMTAAPWATALPEMDVNKAGATETTAMASASWSYGYVILMLFMWWIMMIAMMVPSAARIILLFALINRKQREKDQNYVSTGIFALGYLIAWGVFSVVAVAAQWSLETLGLLSSMMVSTNAVLGGILLMAAGFWQLTPLKHACLRHCRSPVEFLSRHWRNGSIGALRMGAHHGVFCLGCCWFLMALLFFGGVMNLYWIIGLALFVLIEKTVSAGHWLGVATGIGLIAWGGLLLVGG